MRTLFTLLVYFLLFPCSAQKITRYYDYDWRPVENPVYARFVSVIEWKDSVWERNDYFIKERSLQMKGFYADSACRIANGLFTYYHPNRVLSGQGNYVFNQKEGLWLHYHSNGMLDDSVVYRNGKPIGVSLGYHKNGYISDSSVYNSDGSGMQITWFDDGAPASAGLFGPGRRRKGKWRYYFHSGAVACVEEYDNGKLTDRKYFTEFAEQIGDSTNTNRPAAFPKGKEAWVRYLQKKLYFPSEYKIVNAEKVVVVLEATVNEDGVLTDIEVVVPFHQKFDSIAVDALKESPKWIPAISHGRKVKYAIRQAVTFSQETEE